MMRNKTIAKVETKVKFSKIISVYYYPAKTEVNDYYYSDRQRNEPNVVNKHDYKYNVIEIFKETLEKGTLIVLGNLGRHPSILEYYLDVYDSTIKTKIRSHWWKNLNIDLSYKDDGTPCDLLILVEPLINEIIIKPVYAKSLLILTSFTLKNTILPKHFYLGNIENISKIIKKYSPVKLSNAYTFKCPIVFDYRIPFFTESYVNFHVSRYSSKQEIFLCIANFIDYIANLKINKWSVIIE